MTDCPSFDSHAVFNQVPPLEDVNLYRLDPALGEWSTRYGAAWADGQLASYGKLAGGTLMRSGFLANAHPPCLHTHDRYGHRLDAVGFHPAYHEVLAAGVQAGIPSLPWSRPGKGAHVARAGLMYLHNQAEAGTSCPMTMTFASVPVLRMQPDVGEPWLRAILSARYDARDLPFGQKDGVTLGMAMTEKQGGTDLRANTTEAFPVAMSGPGRVYRLVGHKWFCSAPMSDAFLTLAQTGNGLSCFLLPRHWPEGEGRRNGFRLLRLKDKLGNWSNASSEVEFHNAQAWLMGEEGRGIATILTMVALTRFDCMVGSASLMRQALTQAVHHCRHRQVAGRALVEQPLMINVLADLALESEAALALTLRMAAALDAGESAFVRLVTAVGKYWICKRAPAMVNEAAECLGGAGYVEDFILPRLYREAPVNSIWEGSGNVQCLDVLRALSREPDTLEALYAELGDGHGDRRLREHVAQLKRNLAIPEEGAYRARYLTESIALALQARLLLEAGNEAVSDLFIASRLEGAGRAWGTLPVDARVGSLVERALPGGCV